MSDRQSAVPPVRSVPESPVPAPLPPGPPTNTFAIVALVASFTVPIVGIVFGHVALSQITRTGEEGRGLALAGLIIGYSLTGLIVAFVLLYIVFAGLMFAVWAFLLALAAAANGSAAPS